MFFCDSEAWLQSNYLRQGLWEDMLQSPLISRWSIFLSGMMYDAAWPTALTGTNKLTARSFSIGLNWCPKGSLFSNYVQYTANSLNAFIKEIIVALITFSGSSAFKWGKYPPRCLGFGVDGGLTTRRPEFCILSPVCKHFTYQYSATPRLWFPTIPNSLMPKHNRD